MLSFKSFLPFILSLSVSMPLLAQVEVQGHVLDGSNPVIGAVVKVKGGTSGVLSDFNGSFLLNVPEGATIVVSSLGYKDVKANVPKGGGSAIMEFRMDKGKAVVKKPSEISPTQTVPLTTTPSSNIVRTRKTHEKTGFTWTELKNGDLYGVEINGKTIVPCRYNHVDYNPGYFDVCIYGNPMVSACYTEDGTCIIPESRGYNSLSSYLTKDDDYISVDKDGKAGACNKRGEEVVSPTLGYEQISFNRQQPNLCTVKKNGTWGLYSLTAGRELIPTTSGYTSISLWNVKNNCVEVKKSDKVGIYDVAAQKELIPLGRYESIYMNNAGGILFFEVKKGDKEGICLKDGREVIPPRYESILYSSGQFCYKASNGSWYDLGIDINGNKVQPQRTPSTASASSSQTSSVSSSSSSNSSSSSTASSRTSASSSSGSSGSEYGSLLFGGTYTCNGKTIQNLQIVQTAYVFTCDLQVYERVLVYNQNEYFYYSGNQQLFQMNFRKYVDSKNQTFFVHESGVTAYYAIYNTQFVPYAGNITTVVYVILEQGDTRGQQSVGGGYSPQGGAITGGTGTSGNVCPICHGAKTCTNPSSPRNYKEYCQGSRRCGNCSGSGHVPAGYGQSGYVPCSYCNRRVNNNYSDGVCGKCHGTGLCHLCGGTGYR